MRRLIAHLGEHPVSHTPDYRHVDDRLLDVIVDLSPHRAYVLQAGLPGPPATVGYDPVPVPAGLEFPRDLLDRIERIELTPVGFAEAASSPSIARATPARGGRAFVPVQDVVHFAPDHAPMAEGGRRVLGRIRISRQTRRWCPSGWSDHEVGRGHRVDRHRDGERD